MPGFSKNAEISCEYIQNNNWGVDVLTPEMASHIKILWNEQAVQQVFAHRAKIGKIFDSSAYFFENIDRIAEPSYTPNKQV